LFPCNRKEKRGRGRRLRGGLRNGKKGLKVTITCHPKKKKEV